MYYTNMYQMMQYMIGYGWYGGGWFFGVIINFLIAIVLVLLIVWLVKQIKKGN